MEEKLHPLQQHIEKLHTTEMGIDRIRKNISCNASDVVSWCKEKIRSPHAVISQKGKNWYVHVDGYIFTINTHSYTIITAHPDKTE